MQGPEEGLITLAMPFLLPSASKIMIKLSDFMSTHMVLCLIRSRDMFSSTFTDVIDTPSQRRCGQRKQDRGAGPSRECNPRHRRQLCDPQAFEGAPMAGLASLLDVPLHPDLPSWLNAVEGFFAKLTRRCLKRRGFRSVVDLQVVSTASAPRQTPIANPSSGPPTQSASPPLSNAGRKRKSNPTSFGLE
jgi:hypothetical protein